MSAAPRARSGRTGRLAVYVALAIGAQLALPGPAEAATEDRGFVQQQYYDNAGQYHDLRTWNRVDYTLHRIRPYAYNYSSTNTFKGAYNNFYSNSGQNGPTDVSGAYRQTYELAITAPGSFACNGPHRWYNDARYQFYEGSTPIDRNLYATPFDSAC